MSSYRDDTQETAVASSSTWAGLQTLTEEIGRIAEAVLFGLLVVTTETAAASDAVEDRVMTLVQETATASDAAPSRLMAASLTTDGILVSEHYMERLNVLHSETAEATDTVIDSTLAVTTELAQAADHVIPQRHVETLVSELATANDAAFQAGYLLIAESATAADTVISKTVSTVLVAESASAADQVLESLDVGAYITTETGSVSDEITGLLHAVSVVEEAAMAEDAELSAQVGQAWTANTESWAMSRYSPYTFAEIAVIDGVAYGVASDGLYALNGGAGEVAGTIAFGQLDLGGKNGLVHPTDAFLEYEKTNGAAELDVTTTQKGTAQTYTYQLAAEEANKLTNGRFILGKGLRGRHFQLTLRLSADRAYINDLRVSMTPTKRRV